MAEAIQVHHVDDVLYAGTHPIPEVANNIAVRMGESAEHVAAFEAFLAGVPNLNETYSGAIKTIHRQLEKDFGATTAEVPITILSEDQYAQAVTVAGHPLNSGEQGQYLNGRILLAARPERLNAFGANYLVSIGLHEGAHASMGEQHEVVVTRTLTHQYLGKTALHGEPYYHLITAPGGGYGGFKVFFESNEDGPNLFHWEGDAWEEGFAESYRVRAERELGIERELDLTVDDRTVAEGIKVGYVGASEQRPYFDRATGTTYLPWKYLTALTVNNESGDVRLMEAPISALLAYGIDLLDKRLPGLFQDMMASRTDPMAFSSFVAKVNSVKPGLYQALRRLPNNAMGYQQGLVMIEEALGIADDMVELE